MNWSTVDVEQKKKKEEEEENSNMNAKFSRVERPEYACKLHVNVLVIKY